MKRFNVYQVLCLAIMVFGVSCNKDDDNSDDNMDPNAALKAEVVVQYADIVYYSYLDSYNTAIELKNQIDAFVATPTQTGFDACKTAWLAAREPYGQTEVYRFYDGPIDGIFDGVEGPEGALNAWPLDEGHIDYISGDLNNGQEQNLVNDLSFDLTAESISGQNGFGGAEENVSTGYHAIEFLLWGQDLTDPSAKQAGQRAYTDFVTDGSGTNENQDRRGTYLKLCAQLIVDQLDDLVQEWDADGTDNYRADFIMDIDAALKRMLSGMGFLSNGELAGERIKKALVNKDQEEEHSCFSDNTHRDIVANAKGVQNVYYGTYERVDGTEITGESLSSLMAVIDADLNTELLALLTDTWTKVNAIPAPFDDAITTAETEVNATIDALVAQSIKIQEVGSSIGVGEITVQD